MAVITATFETGVSGNTIATGDAGALTAWNAVNLPATSTVAYDNTQAHSTSLSAKIATGGTAGAAHLDWIAAFGTQTDHYGRVYLYMTANPAASLRIIRLGSASSAAASIEISTTGKIRLLDSASVLKATSTNSITLNAWVRIEFHIIHSTTVGQLEAKLFNTPDSTTVTETLTTVATLNTLASADRIFFGVNVSQANVSAFWFDDILAVATSYPGPVVGDIPTLIMERRTPRRRVLQRM